MKFNKIKDRKEKRPTAGSRSAKPNDPANSTGPNKSNKVIKKKRFFKQKLKKPADATIKTKVCIPQSGEEVSANWMQMAELIKNENAKKISGQASSKPVSGKPNKKLTKELTKKEKFKLKRKLKREHAKLKKKTGGDKQADKAGGKRTGGDKTSGNRTGEKQNKMPDKRKEHKPQEKSNDLWFEVDQIYLDKALNPGQPAQPIKDDDLVKKHASTGLTKAIGIDCEMVGVGPKKQSALARISMVNQFGHTIYDKFVKPDEKITDYRTFVSGIRPGDLKDGLNIDIARGEVEEIVRGRVLIGHAIRNDLAALGIRHPPAFVRDTSIYFKTMFNGKVPSLKRLSETLLNVKVQTGEHSSVEDAKATMRLYTLYKKDWEASLSKSNKKRQST